MILKYNIFKIVMKINGNKICSSCKILIIRCLFGFIIIILIIGNNRNNY